jgi:hypothetical protein
LRSEVISNNFIVKSRSNIERLFYLFHHLFGKRNFEQHHKKTTFEKHQPDGKFPVWFSAVAGLTNCKSGCIKNIQPLSFYITAV